MTAKSLHIHLFIILRFSFRAILAGSILVHAITLLAIKRQKYLITPQILHDGDSTRKSRHNRAIVTLKAVGAFLLFYLFVAGMLFVFSRAKGKPFYDYKQHCHVTIITCRKFCQTAGQTLAQLLLWCFLGPLHTFLTQTYLLTNPEPRSYIKRAINNMCQYTYT